MAFNINDLVRHAKFGDGQILDERDDKYMIRFVEAGEKLMLKTAIDTAGAPPYPGFTFPKTKSAASARSQAERSSRRPPLEFDHLVKRFLDVFEGGFNGASFHERERKYKEEAAQKLAATLNEEALAGFIAAEKYDEACQLAFKI